MIKQVLLWILLFVSCMGIITAILIGSTMDPRRDVLLESQLQQIAHAQTVEDLRPILEQIVRKQRHDYK